MSNQNTNGPTFKPQWSHRDQFYGKGGFNMDRLRMFADESGEQLTAVTLIVNEQDKRIHELETQVAELKATLTQLTMTAPTERKGKAGKEVEA